MKKRDFLSFLVLIIILSACDNAKQQAESASTAVEESTPTFDMQTPPEILGKVRGKAFEMEQAIIDNGTLTLREGEDFFADLSIEIVTFEDDVAGKTFDITDSTIHSRPHVRLGLREEGENLPDQVTLMDDYTLHLRFDQRQPLGIPFEIRFKAADHNTQIEGHGLATFGNIKIVDGEMDPHFDSFDTLKMLAKTYIRENYDVKNFVKDFGVSYKSIGKDFPKSGFVGYEIIEHPDKTRVVKLQFKKTKVGWGFVNELKPDQIHQAHPVDLAIEGDASVAPETGKPLEQVAGLKFESDAVEKAFMENVRATSTHCAKAKSNDKASCRVIYAFKTEDTAECRAVTYLLVRESESWAVQSEIANDKKVDYQSGELVEQRRPVPQNC